MWKPASAVVFAAVFATSSVVLAQTREKAAAKPRSAASLECSKQADAKGLHGKERRKFRSKCLKQMKKAA